VNSKTLGLVGAEVVGTAGLAALWQCTGQHVMMRAACCLLYVGLHAGYVQRFGQSEARRAVQRRENLDSIATTVDSYIKNYAGPE
jgi:hypothetical protein